jgi:hypothetical protein
MRIALTLVVALLLAVSGSAATANGHGGVGRASLTLLKPEPLKLRGIRFLAGERVRVTVSVPSPRAKRVTASAAGSFAAAFADVSVDPCSGLTAVAVGSRGSRATLKLPQRQCPPRL